MIEQTGPTPCHPELDKQIKWIDSTVLYITCITAHFLTVQVLQTAKQRR